MTPLKIALVSSEVAPFAKSGGLADVVGALARALHLAGHEVRVLLPLYRSLKRPGPKQPRHEFAEVAGLEGWTMQFGERRVNCRVVSTPLPHSADARGQSLVVGFLDCPELYDREGLYTSDADEALRFAALCRGAVEACQRTGFAPDVFHCNDWHTGLLPLYLKTWYAWDRLFAGSRTLLTIHNLGYRGDFPAATVDQLGLGEGRHLFHQEHLNAGRLSLLETGIIHAHWLSTVSETYAREIQTAEHGVGLDGLLRAREDHLVGIVNGIDTDEWNPARDPLIPHPFSAADLSGKALCKRALLERFQLPHDPRALTLGIVSRMTAQKGFELLPDCLPVLLQRQNVRLVVLGSGEERHERYFQWLRDTYPQKVACYLGYSEELAHQIEAGVDLFLMPSRYEPCGLNQMYSLAYGTVPLVRHTGGLADTVVRYDPERQTGTGFVFYEFTSEALLRTLEHALDVWRDPPAWRGLVQRGLAQDFSWTRQAQRYVDLYRRLLTG
jgi:starch synthase